MNLTNLFLSIWVFSLTKEERRRLFALRVAQEDEELRLKRYHEDIWRRHLEHCLALGLDPAVNAYSIQNNHHYR